MTNKQALREAAEKAGADNHTQDEWFHYLRCSYPATVLALLDELEAKDKSISFLKDQLAQLANFNPDWDKLEAAKGSLREHMAELTSARARIAEMEAREVVLPPRYSMLHRDGFDEPYHTVFVYKQHQVIEVLQAAGIRINGEG